MFSNIVDFYLALERADYEAGYHGPESPRFLALALFATSHDMLAEVGKVANFPNRNLNQGNVVFRVGRFNVLCIPNPGPRDLIGLQAIQLYVSPALMNATLERAHLREAVKQARDRISGNNTNGGRAELERMHYICRELERRFLSGTRHRHIDDSLRGELEQAARELGVRVDWEKLTYTGIIEVSPLREGSRAGSQSRRRDDVDDYRAAELLRRDERVRRAPAQYRWDNLPAPLPVPDTLRRSHTRPVLPSSPPTTQMIPALLQWEGEPSRWLEARPRTESKTEQIRALRYRVRAEDLKPDRKQKPRQAPIDPLRFIELDDQAHDCPLICSPKSP